MNKRLKVLFGTVVVTPLALTVLKVHTRLTRQERARVIIVNELNEVLCVRGIVGTKWSLPGGGIEKGESAVQAAARETYEETGIRVREQDLQLLAVIAPAVSDVNYTAHLFRVDVQKAMLPTVQFNRIEIIDLAWIDPTALPDRTSKLTRVGLHLLSKQ